MLAGNIPFEDDTGGGIVQWGCAPAVYGPPVEEPAQVATWNWASFSRSTGEAQCGGALGPIQSVAGQGVVVDNEGGIWLSAPWRGNGVIGAGTPAEVTINTTSIDIVILRLAPP